MVYENILIKIRPILPDNITIDESNNIHIKYQNKFVNLFNLINEDIKFIEINNYKVYFEELRFKKNQVVILKKQGIPLINSNDILDNKTKCNVLIHINLE